MNELLYAEIVHEVEIRPQESHQQQQQQQQQKGGGRAGGGGGFSIAQWLLLFRIHRFTTPFSSLLLIKINVPASQYLDRFQVTSISQMCQPRGSTKFFQSHSAWVVFAGPQLELPVVRVPY